MAVLTGGSRPISRVLSWAAIHLGSHVTMRLKRPTREHARAARCGTRPLAPLFGLAPGGVYRAAACCHPRGALLPHLFTLTGIRRRLGGMFSVALSVGSRPPGVTWHPALWSPDFPRRISAPRLPGRLPVATIEAMRPAYKRNASASRVGDALDDGVGLVATAGCQFGKYFGGIAGRQVLQQYPRCAVELRVTD